MVARLLGDTDPRRTKGLVFVREARDLSTTQNNLDKVGR